MAILNYDGTSHLIKKVVDLINSKADKNHKHTKSDITDFPTLGTASSKDVASSGNASTTQVVMGNDTRLTDARKASDVSAWAKASSKPSYTKSEVGLGNVDNTSDINKPVSTAQQTAIDIAYANSNKYTDQKIADLIDGAPETMDTLKEVADAIAENKDVETALNEAIGTKANQSELDTHTGNTTIHITPSERTNWTAAKTHADSEHARTDATKVEKSTTNGNIKINGTETNVYTHPSGTNPHGTTKSDVGLSNVDNTADANKSVKYAESSGSVKWEGITEKPSSYPPASHTHDDRYYTETEMNTKLGNKVDLSADGVSKAINQLSTGGSTPSDTDYYISQYAGGGTTTTSYHRRPMSALWDYIKGKISSVLGLTNSSYGGNAASATKVNGHTVESDVPSGAKFTDTTYTLDGLMGSSAKGSATQPVYWTGSAWANTTYTLGKSVPSNAVFTDTTYSNFVKSGSGAKAGLVPAPSTTAGTTKYLREDGTWVVPPSGTTYTSKDAETNGTDVSLVITGEKATWNSKASYEEGTFTPNFYDSSNVKQTFSEVSGYYKRIGNLCYINIYGASYNGSCMIRYIDGFPFMPNSTIHYKNKPSHMPELMFANGNACYINVPMSHGVIDTNKNLSVETIQVSGIYNI